MTTLIHCVLMGGIVFFLALIVGELQILWEEWKRGNDKR